MVIAFHTMNASLEDNTMSDPLGAKEPISSDPNNDIGAQAYEADFDFQDGNLGDDEVDSFAIDEDRFTTETPVWNDTKFAIFFLIVFVLFIVKSFSLIVKHMKTLADEIPPSQTVPNSLFFSLKSIFLILVTIALSTAVTMKLFFLAGKKSIRLVETGIKFITGFFMLATVAAFFIRQYIQGFLFGIVTAILFTIIIKFKQLITLAGNILSIVISVLMKYPATAFAAGGGYISTSFFTGLLSIANGCTYIAYGFHGDGTPRFDDQGNKISQVSTGFVLTLLFLNFAGLYIVDVARNVMHVTIGGIYGTWYYTEQTFNGMPKNEGTGSFKRAMTYNFGSLCFGSLCVVIFQCIAVTVLLIDRNQGYVGQIGDLILRLTSTGVGYFNLYVFSFVALYGSSMMRSVKATYKFFKDRGLQAFCNDFIISLALGFYCLIAAFISGIFIAIFLYIFKAIVGIREEFFAPLLTSSLVVSFNITTVLILTIVSGSSVFFYALNKDPSVYQESHQFEFQEISRCFPRVLQRVNLQ